MGAIEFMAEFKHRMLELHSKHVWNYDWVMKAMRFMKEHQMNGLVLHRNDLIDLIIYPGQYFGAERAEYRTIFERYQDIFRKLYKYTPTRRSGPYQRRAYLKRILEMARRQGVEVYIQNKELFFPDIILEFYPHLVKDGAICANDPFWWEFTRVKYKEFFEEFPEISGIITAPATGESRVSITSNRCTCERCANTKREEWFENLVKAMYEPISAAGKKLIIRDFVFDPEAHADIVKALEQLPTDIIFSLKNTPHDYYPTFPDNPRLSGDSLHQQWVEYDSMGQYFGWGIAPSIMIDDYRRRMTLAKDNGVQGVIIRTDWESLDAHSSFDTLNKINLYAFSALTKNLKADGVAIVQQWMEDEAYFKADLTAEEKREAAEWAGAILNQTWDITSKTNYVQDCVFSDSSQLPVSMEHALWLAEEKNSLKDWVPEKADALSTERDNLERILSEKDEALKHVQQLLRQVKAGHPYITEACHQYLVECFEIYEEYVQAFRAVVHAIFLTKYMLDHQDQLADDYSQHVEVELEKRLQDLTHLAEHFDTLFKTTNYYHRVYTLLDADRLIALRSDLYNKLDQLKGGSKV